MPGNALLLILLTLVLAMAVAGFQYFYKTKGSRRHYAVFAILRFFSVWMILMLLVNPKIKNTTYFTEKQDLVLAVDNSASIAQLQKSDAVRSFVNAIGNDPQIRDRFKIHIFGFGAELEKDPELSFDRKQTNIPATLSALDKLFADHSAPTLLITDGNQTQGQELVYSAADYRNDLLPVLVGDTSAYKDIRVSRVNSNRYSFLGNRFPVEVLVNYSGEESEKTRLDIKSGNRVVFSEEILVDAAQNSVVLRTELTSSSIGVQTYSVALAPLENEENTLNNKKDFVIEVIDERSKILLLYDLVHPDLGAVKKAIESNAQRDVVLRKIGEEETDLEEYQLVILYQPDASFIPVLETLSENRGNFLVITGPETNWQTLNTYQEILRHETTGQTEEYLAKFNRDFDLFQVADVGFSDFPPLTGNFGNLESREGSHVLLYRNIQDIETQAPLMAFWNGRNSKVGFLLGSGIWTWRSHVYRREGSFEVFDEFISKTVQFLSSGQNRNRFVVSYEPLYQGSSNVQITAEYFDRNYVFDPGAEIYLELKNEGTGTTRTIPFVRRADQYRVNLELLSPGAYSFTARVAEEPLSRSGKFSLSPFDVEKQFSRADLESLRQVAAAQERGLSFVEDPLTVKEYLLSAKKYLPVQKSREKTVPLIEWYYLLGILILSLSAEWFSRKYYGFI